LCSTALFLSTVASAGCGDENETTAVTPSTSDAGSNECAPAPPAAKPAASCEVTIESPPVGSANHLPEGTQITYCSNPPSSGPHYPVWADFQVYDKPIEWPYLVHSMEHGSVVLLYKCDAPGCPEIVADLVKVRDNAAADPLCSAGTKRIIVAPSTTILTKVAAAAWGKTYQADCVDMPTLEAFVRDNYAKGPENICVPGRTF
jgi:hypothetical protein